MKKNGGIVRKIYTVLIALGALLLVAGAVWVEKAGDGTLRNFSDGWMDDEGVRRDVGVHSLRYQGMSHSLERELPQTITEKDCLCFESVNVNFSVCLDEDEIYSFQTHENLTGVGYGFAMHTVGLCSADAGRKVTIYFEKVHPNAGGGRIQDVYISPAEDYMRLQLAQKSPTMLIAVLIIGFGVLSILVFVRLSGRGRLPFDAGALGLAAVIMGFWLMLDSNILQLMTGLIFAERVLNRLLILLVMYPTITYFNSLTKQKRLIYQHIAFGITVLTFFTLVGLRYLVGIDMITSFSKGIVFYIVAMSLLTGIIFVDELLYCRANEIEADLGGFFFGLAALLTGGIIDLVIYFLKLRILDSYGTFTSIGMLAFIAIMLMRFLSWWNRDQALIERDRFLNRALEYFVSSESPDEGIREIMGFTGSELKPGLILLFEERGEGKYRGTYRWDAKVSGPGAGGLLYLPEKGFVDELYKVFRSEQKSLIIEDIEKYRTSDPALYNMLSSDNVDCMVACPLETDKKLVGMLTLIDLPREDMEKTADYIEQLSRFLTQLLMRRDEQAKLRAYSYNDVISGALNRRAYKEFLEEKLDLGSAFGYLICEISGLKNANDTRGYESGDRMILEITAVLSDVFGKEQVFRVGGTEFVAFGFESEEMFFLNDVERVRRQAIGKGLKIYTGEVYCTYGTHDISKVIRRANEHLMEDREQEMYKN
ncbi:MAG: diguanylate cyclase [Lachnospiraceae bacterium]|nr:diguanylate cyclase [Lachnospiraceae bacterium]